MHCVAVSACRNPRRLLMNHTHKKPLDAPDLLVVDDDVFFCRIIEQQLQRANMHAHCVHTGAAMFDHLLRQNPDLVILDYYLAEESGLALCRRLRRISSVPLIMLTGESNASEIVACLDAGADDYVMKPHDRNQLIARVRALLRRSQLHQEPHGASSILRFGDIELEPDSRLLRRADQQIQLSQRECLLLQILHAQYPAPLDRERASWVVLQRELTPGDRTIDLLISRLRKRLHSITRTVDVLTLRNLGYQLRTDCRPP